MAAHDMEDMFNKTQGAQHLKFKEEIKYTENVYNYANDIINYILDNSDTITKKEIERQMIHLSKIHKLKKRPRFFVINYIIKQKIDKGEINEEQYNLLMIFLTSKKMRSLSGILEVAIMTEPFWKDDETGESKNFSCEFDCHYCPNQPGMPRSYVSDGPSARRAIRLNFDTVWQFYERASVYAVNGHPVDKIEVIVLGGTWDSYPISYQRQFVNKVYYAANTFYSTETRNMLSMEEEIKINETALCKIIGLTFETRPDQISQEQILRLLSYGCTRVQIGIQHSNNKILKGINRQCPIEKSYDAIYLLKEAGLKVQTHWMPNLPGADPEKDMRMFDELNYNQKLQSDDIKIYPTIVTKTSTRDDEEVFTVIEKKFLSGIYIPYSNEDLDDVIIYGKSHIQPQVRISRVFRDIPMGNILGGADKPNLREILAKKMKERGLHCECIRCREVRDRIVDPKDIEIKIHSYHASESIEYFISAESLDGEGLRIVHGFIRLRIPHINKNKWIKDLEGCALIRELHVYGQMIPHFTNSYSYNQHKGLGRKLINCAEDVASRNGFKKIAVTSGVGVRKYYEKIGYRLGDYYMIKQLSNNDCFEIIKFPITCIIILVLIYIIIRVVTLVQH